MTYDNVHTVFKKVFTNDWKPASFEQEMGGDASLLFYTGESIAFSSGCWNDQLQEDVFQEDKTRVLVARRYTNLKSNKVMMRVAFDVSDDDEFGMAIAMCAE